MRMQLRQRAGVGAHVRKRELRRVRRLSQLEDVKSLALHFDAEGMSQVPWVSHRGVKHKTP